MRWWTVLSLVAACGSGADAPDAGEPIPPVDAGPPGPITVTALSRCCTGPSGVPVEGVSVIVGFETVTTDASGTATIDVRPGAAVTVVYPVVGTEPPAMLTWVGVEPGDSLVFGEDFVDLPPPSATATITWAAQTADQYYVWDGCTRTDVVASATSAAVRSYGAACGTPATDILLLATGPAGQMRWAMLRDVTIVDGATIAMPEFADAGTFTVGVTGLPPSYETVSVSAVAEVGRIDSLELLYQGSPAGGSFSVSGPWAAASRVRASVDLRMPSNFGYKRATRILDPAVTSAILDDPPLPPWLSSFGGSKHDLAVEVSGPGEYGVTVADLVWGPDDERHWRIFGPPEHDFSWRGLPAPFHELEPDSFESFIYLVTLVDIDGMTYDEIRALPEAEVRGQRITLPRGETHDF